ncbi:hypothetical protein GCM10009539_22720 [Cryptosporangium japonicum]|uniref:Tyr recombinase domain-containing protein n=1 Tax=Cryptosporangium japonicum TaxID=80872 RepID=A0ABN0U2X2_9ACTN
MVRPGSDRAVPYVTQQRTEVPGQVLVGPSKSRASRRSIALDQHTIGVLRAHAERQRFERRAAGAEWTDTGYVFTRHDGRPLSPSVLTHRLAQLVADTGLPPVRLHDPTCATARRASRTRRERI